LGAMNGGKPVSIAQINQMKMIAKLKGTITDTYQNIQTNANVSLAELEPPAPVVPVAVAAAPPPQEQGGEGGGGGGGGGGRGGGGRHR
ncbi:MAG: hypothetical protein ABSF38_12455, partial [Verrucomicrobiota bacterium]